MRMDVKQLDEQSWQLSEGSGRGAVHCYLLVGEQKALLIDTGKRRMPLAKCVRALTSLPVIVVNTHGHFDHITKNGQFEKVYLHTADRRLYEEHMNPQMRFQYECERWIRKGKPQWLLDFLPIRESLKHWNTPYDFKHPSALQEDEVLELGNRKLTVIHTPGHTQGSICLLEEERRWLFCGDTICEAGVLLHMAYNAGVEAYAASLKKLLDLKSKYTLLYPGHQRSPLSVAWVADFYECAMQILSEDRALEQTEWKVKNARIQYDPKQIRKEEE